MYIYIYIYTPLSWLHNYMYLYDNIPLSCGLITFKTLNSKVEVFLVSLFNVAISVLLFPKKQETAGVFFWGGASSQNPTRNPALDEGPLKMLKSLAGFRSRPNLSTAFTKAVSCRSHGGELFFKGKKKTVLVAENSTNPFWKNMWSRQIRS